MASTVTAVAVLIGTATAVVVGQSQNHSDVGECSCPLQSLRPCMRFSRLVVLSVHRTDPPAQLICRALPMSVTILFVK